MSNKQRITGPLNQGDHVTITENTDSVGARAGTSWGTFAKLARGCAGDADLIYTFNSNKNTVYSCDLLEAFEFEPDNQYILDSISASLRVQNFSEQSFQRNKTVYMITGLKIATGFKMSSSTSKEHGPKVKVGMDFSALGVPIEASRRQAGRNLDCSPTGEGCLLNFQTRSLWLLRFQESRRSLEVGFRPGEMDKGCTLLNVRDRLDK